MGSCAGGGKTVEMSPEEVVEAFSRAVAAGDFATAYELCDTVGMKDYIDNYREALTSLQKVDSSATAIAASMLSGAEFEVTDIDRDGETVSVRYRLEAEGNTKTKTATVKKEEGGWRVTSVTDRI